MKDENQAISFFKNKGIEAQKISDNISGKIPDLELHINAAFLGYCEIKSIVPYNLIDERRDPSYKKIQNKIHEVFKQFEAYNQNYACPNSLLFMNHFQHTGFRDL